MLKQEEILIIGNGCSVLDYSFGEQINKFPIVGRINNYSTKFIFHSHRLYEYLL